MQNPPGPTFGALCAIHPDRTARMTCRRCGNFMCDECSVGGSETLCPKCLQLSGYQSFPYDRNSVGFSELINYCWELFKREWVMLSVVVLILMGIGMVSNFLGSIFQGIFQAVGGKGIAATFAAQALATFLTTLVQGAFQMGVYRVNFDVLEGKKPDLARLFSQTAKIGRYVVQMLIVFVAFGLPVLIYAGVVLAIAMKTGQVPTDPNDWNADILNSPVLMIGSFGGAVIFIPLWIYFGLPLGFASMEIVYGDVDAVEALKRSFKIASGFRLWLIGYGFVGSAILLVGLLACCIGMIPATALLTLINTAFYFAIRNGSGLPQAPPG